MLSSSHTPSRKARITPEVAPQLLHRETVEKMTGTPRSSIYRWMSAGEFPRPVKIGPRAVRWRASDIEAWLEQRAQTGNAQEAN